MSGYLLKSQVCLFGHVLAGKRYAHNFILELEEKITFAKTVEVQWFGKMSEVKVLTNIINVLVA